MKIVVCGKSFAACNSLEYLSDLVTLFRLDLQICVVPNNSDTKNDTWEPSLSRRAHDLGCNVYHNYTEIDFATQDILISIQFDKIIKTTKLNGASAFNIHFSNLPKYRGCFPSMLPIRRGEKQAGVTLHVLTDGIDDGPIIDQQLFDIHSFMTSFDLYKMYNEFGYILFKNNIQDIINNSYNCHIQSAEFSYFNKQAIDYNNNEITNIELPCIQLRDYIRSLIFPPYQLPIFRGNKITSCDVLSWKGSTYLFSINPGILIIDKRHSVIKCLDGMLRLEFLNEP